MTQGILLTCCCFHQQKKFRRGSIELSHIRCVEIVKNGGGIIPCQNKYPFQVQTHNKYTGINERFSWKAALCLTLKDDYSLLRLFGLDFLSTISCFDFEPLDLLYGHGPSMWSGRKCCRPFYWMLCCSHSPFTLFLALQIRSFQTSSRQISTITSWIIC